MYREEVVRLKAQRRFLHYNPRYGNKIIEHKRALEDIRALINVHGVNGAWLWDPFLSADDIMDTLVYCIHARVDLRALGGGQRYRNFGDGHPDPVLEQRSILDSIQSNWSGLRLEYRMRRGQYGWGFHDRFLIFPGEESGALAWSLGTSVNSLGKEHHILQQVDDGQLIMDEFLELWDELDHSECVVWKRQ